MCLDSNQLVAIFHLMKAISALLALAIFLLFNSTPALAQTAWVLDHVEGSFTPDTISAGVPITFYLKMQNYNEWQAPLVGATNGFRIYSPDNAHWLPVSAYDVIDISQYFDLLNTIGYLSVDGQGHDTVYFVLSCAQQSGLPANFDEVTHAITTFILPEYHGRRICLDSTTFLGMSGVWLWTYGPEVGSLRPEWNGPYCFQIDSSSCCQLRGNIDHDPEQEINISDLIYLAQYMFQEGPLPPCPAEANCTGDPDDEVDISDLIHLVQFMFQDGPPPTPCP